MKGGPTPVYPWISFKADLWTPKRETLKNNRFRHWKVQRWKEGQKQFTFEFLSKLTFEAQNARRWKIIAFGIQRFKGERRAKTSLPLNVFQSWPLKPKMRDIEKLLFSAFKGSRVKGGPKPVYLCSSVKAELWTPKCETLKHDRFRHSKVQRWKEGQNQFTFEFLSKLTFEPQNARHWNIIVFGIQRFKGERGAKTSLLLDFFQRWPLNPKMRDTET